MNHTIPTSRNRNMSLRYALLMGPWLLSFIMAACGLVDTEEDDVAIIVGSNHITVNKLKKDMEFVSAGLSIAGHQRDQIRNQIIEQCINNYLIAEYGKIKGFTVSDEEFRITLEKFKREYTETSFNEALLRGYVDFDQWKRRLREQMLRDKIVAKISDNIEKPTYEEIKQYYELHLNEFTSPKMIKFRQIVTQSREEAQSLLERIRKGEKMSELAKQYSVAPEAEENGIVGWVAKNHLNESMEKVLFSLKTGQISSVVETPYGFHIFEVMSGKAAGLKTFPEVIKEIEAKLLNEQREGFINRWLKDLRDRFGVKINKNILNNLELS